MLSSSNSSTIVDIEVTSLGRSDVPEAASVMARAFCNSPSYNYVLSNFDDEAARMDVLEFLFVGNLNILFDKCPSACKCARRMSDGKMVATFLWTPKEHEEIDTWTMIRYGGAWQLPFRLGWTGLRNLWNVMDDFQTAFCEITESLQLARKYQQHVNNSWITLERMTVLPEYQGKGIGSAALQIVLKTTTGLVRLATQEERNVRFYEKLGFQVEGERDFGSDGNVYHSWFLFRLCKGESD